MELTVQNLVKQYPKKRAVDEFWMIWYSNTGDEYGNAKQKAKQTQARVDINSLEAAFSEYEKDKGFILFSELIPEWFRHFVFGE